jgi:heme/copper-type cytochrome/quinol oxidase subunit 2
MTFYTYNYLKGGQTNWGIVKLAIIAVLAVAFFIFLIKYSRNKWDLKYRDLTIILATLLLLAAAIQYSDLTNLHTASVQSGQLTVVIEKSAKKLGVEPETIAINDTSRNNDMLIKTPKGYYSLVFNGSGSEFLLSKVDLFEPDITMVGE